VDFDSDGHDDILSGSYPGELYFFRGKGDGEFAKGEAILNQEGQPVTPGKASTVFATDWDDDGDLDLVCGHISGGAYLLINEGAKRKARLSGEFKILQAGGTDLFDGAHSGVVVADWDGDGLQDLIVGTDNDARLYRNIGKRGAPKFAAGEVLVKASLYSQLIPRDGAGLAIGQRIKPHVVDYNDDGKLDLLLGEFSSMTIQRDGLTDEEKVKLADLKKAKALMDAKYQEIFKDRDQLLNQVFSAEEKAAYWAVARPRLMGEKIERTEADSRAVKAGHDYVDTIDELRPRQDELNQALEKFGTEEYETLGSVWLYLRK
jgi:hypothetical protein